MGKKPYVEIRDPWCPSYPDHDGTDEFATSPKYSTREKCFACDRALKQNTKRYRVTTSDGQQPYVGPCCYRRIAKSNGAGYQPPLGGPRLYLIQQPDDTPDAEDFEPYFESAEDRCPDPYLEHKMIRQGRRLR